MARLKLTMNPNGFATISVVQELSSETIIESFLEGLVYWEMKGNAQGSFLSLTMTPGLVEFVSAVPESDGQGEDAEETYDGRASQAAH